MIEKTWAGNYEFACDNLDCQNSETFDVDGDFQRAVIDAKQHGWRITKSNGEWKHICWRCNRI